MSAPGGNAMDEARRPRLLLLVPTSTYRAEAFVRAAKKLPVEISIASEKPSALSHLHPVELPAFDFSDTEAAVSFAREFAANTRVDAVVPVDDQATMAAAAISHALGLPGNTPKATYATINKFETRRHAQRAGICQPSYRLVDIEADPVSVAAAIDYPVVVKPLALAASRGVIRADNATGFVDAFHRVSRIVGESESRHDPLATRHLLVESYVDGWEVAVEGLVSDGELDVLAIFDKPDPLVGPYFPETLYVTPSRLSGDKQQKIIAAARSVVAALGLRHGPVHAEFRGDDENVWFIEIAARSIGGLCSRSLRFAGENSLETVILEHALGLNDGVPSPGPASGVMMLQAPTSGHLAGVKGLESAIRVKHIEEVIITAHPGRLLSPLPDGFLYLGFIFARADTPARVERALRNAFGELKIVIDPVPVRPAHSPTS